MKIIFIFILLAFNNFLFAEKFLGDKFTVSFCKDLGNQSDCLKQERQRVTCVLDFRYDGYIYIGHKPNFNFDLYISNWHEINSFLKYMNIADKIELFVQSRKNIKSTNSRVNARDVMIKVPGKNKMVSLREFFKNGAKRIEEETKKANRKRWKKWLATLPKTWGDVVPPWCNPF